jgi:hypothetical protein
MTNSSDTFVIHFSQDNICKFVEALFDQGIEFEILNPKLLKDKWQNVIFLEGENNPKLDRNLFVIGELINKYDPSYSWIDSRLEGSLREYYHPDEEEELIQKAKKILRQPAVANASEAKKILVNGKLLILNKYKALYTKLQQELLTNHLKAGLFRLNPNSNAIFGIFGVNSTKTETTKSILEYFGINYDVYDWVEEIGHWEQENSEQSWQSYIRTFFFPSQDTVSNLFWVSKLIPLSVGIAIHDVVFGFVMLLAVLFCNLLNISNNSFGNHLKNLSYVSLSVIIFGIITGSYGGSLLKNLPFSFTKDLYGILKNFQIIDITGFSKDLPINQLFQSVNWTSLNWQIYGIGLLAIVVIVLGILQKLRVKIKSSNNSELANFLSFLGCFGVFGYWIASRNITALFLLPLLLLVNFVTCKKNKIVNFVMSDSSILGIINMFVILGTILFIGMVGFVGSYFVYLINSSNINIYVLVFANLIFGIVWILVIYALSTRIMCLSFLKIFNTKGPRIMNNHNKFKYWKF